MSRRNSLSIESKKRRLFKSEIRKEQKILLTVIVIVAALLVLLVLGVVSSLKLTTENYIIEYANLPKNFDGYKIAQITDYHKKIYANQNETLIKEMEKVSPDIIVMTGDLIDKNSKDIDSIAELTDALVDIAPVLWIRGNHFYKSDEEVSAQLEKTLTDMGVISLLNQCYVVTREGENIKLCGVDDPERLYKFDELPGEYASKASIKAMKRFLDETEQNSNGENGFKILLTHRYTIYNEYPEYGYSLTLAGHSHGGQLNLPGGRDLIGHNLKLFPKIKSGYNDIKGMPLIVNSGLGTSNLNLRLYNPPELVVVELKNK